MLQCDADVPKQVDWNSKAALATAVAMDRIVIMAQLNIVEGENDVAVRN